MVLAQVVIAESIQLLLGVHLKSMTEFLLTRVVHGLMVGQRTMEMAAWKTSQEKQVLCSN